MKEQQKESEPYKNLYALDLSFNIQRVNDIYKLVSSIPVDIKHADARHSALLQLEYLRGDIKILCEKIEKKFYG